MEWIYSQKLVSIFKPDMITETKDSMEALEGWFNMSIVR